MKAYKITDYLEQYFPLNLQLDWDKCGLQIGDKNQEVTKILVALNADNESIDNAISNNCNMLITHHPFLLEPIENVDTNKATGSFIKKAIDNNIVVYSLHTCLDIGQNGISMNDWLINCFDVKDVQCFDIDNCGKMATLNTPLNGNEFIDVVKESLNVKNVKYSNNTNCKISKIAVLGGSGADYLEELNSKVDAFITGDTKHRHAKWAIDNGILLIDVNHHVEVIMENKVKDLLSKLDVEVMINDSKDYFNYK
ncbi:MAG: Nif3-like dinuclear metal center hexameric protein [Thomasclavelia sp.]|jgi:dinuclear metal center YbgI/SA1388 family protein|nr:Nif3-like dinuclear metal center hexameric protein [Thomasclavelia sp.]